MEKNRYLYRILYLVNDNSSSSSCSPTTFTAFIVVFYQSWLKEEEIKFYISTGSSNRYLADLPFPGTCFYDYTFQESFPSVVGSTQSWMDWGGWFDVV